MNRFEFIASGHMLYGKTWQTELARTLCFSVESGSIRKIASGKRNVSDGVKDDIIQAMQKKIQDLSVAVAYLQNPEKIKLLNTQYSILTFDEHGVRQWDAFQGEEASQFTVALVNASLPVSQYEINFISSTIAASAEDAFKVGHNRALIEMIDHFFDLSELDVDLSKLIIEY